MRDIDRPLYDPDRCQWYLMDCFAEDGRHWLDTTASRKYVAAQRTDERKIVRASLGRQILNSLEHKGTVRASLARGLCEFALPIPYDFDILATEETSDGSLVTVRKGFRLNRDDYALTDDIFEPDEVHASVIAPQPRTTPKTVSVVYNLNTGLRTT